MNVKDVNLTRTPALLKIYQCMILVTCNISGNTCLFKSNIIPRRVLSYDLNFFSVKKYPNFVKISVQTEVSYIA